MVVVTAGGRLRGRGFDSPIGTFFFFFFFSLLFFFPYLIFFFLHARSAISMLKHFSSKPSLEVTLYLYLVQSELCVVLVRMLEPLWSLDSDAPAHWDLYSSRGQDAARGCM